MSLQIQVAPKADAEKASPEKKTIPQGLKPPLIWRHLRHG